MGFLRLYLALAVMTWHSPPDTSRWLPYSFTAVLIFFVLSGFYISMALEEHYRSDTSRYLVNRAMRLYPAYLAVLLTLGVMGQLASHNVLQLLGEITILPRVLWDNIVLATGRQPDVIYPFTVGPIYTVGLEMVFYLLAPLFVRRSTSALICLFALGLVVHLAPRGLGFEPRYWQYAFFPAVFVFFVSGTLAYRMYRAVKGNAQLHWIGYVAIPLIVGYIWITDQESSGAYANNGRVYILYALVTLTIPFLFIVTKRSAVDRFLGNLAYPLYILHAPIIALLADVERANFVARMVSIVAAVVLAALIERPIENVRDAIRAHKFAHAGH